MLFVSSKLVIATNNVVKKILEFRKYKSPEYFGYTFVPCTDWTRKHVIHIMIRTRIPTHVICFNLHISYGMRCAWWLNVFWVDEKTSPFSALSSAFLLSHWYILPAKISQQKHQTQKDQYPFYGLGPQVILKLYGMIFPRNWGNLMSKKTGIIWSKQIAFKMCLFPHFKQKWWKWLTKSFQIGGKAVRLCETFWEQPVRLMWICVMFMPERQITHKLPP